MSAKPGRPTAKTQDPPDRFTPARMAAKLLRVQAKLHTAGRLEDRENIPPRGVRCSRQEHRRPGRPSDIVAHVKCLRKG